MSLSLSSTREEICLATFNPPTSLGGPFKGWQLGAYMSMCKSFIAFGLLGLGCGGPSPTMVHYSIQRPTDRRVGAEQSQALCGRMKAPFLGILTVASL